MLKYLISISTKKKIKIRIDKSRIRPLDADLQIPDTSKFKKHTGWKPKVSFRDSVQKLLNYCRENYK